MDSSTYNATSNGYPSLFHSRRALAALAISALFHLLLVHHLWQAHAHLDTLALSAGLSYVEVRLHASSNILSNLNNSSREKHAISTPPIYQKPSAELVENHTVTLKPMLQHAKQSTAKSVVSAPPIMSGTNAEPLMRQMPTYETLAPPPVEMRLQLTRIKHNKSDEYDETAVVKTSANRPTSHRHTGATYVRWMTTNDGNYTLQIQAKIAPGASNGQQKRDDESEDERDEEATSKDNLASVNLYRFTSSGRIAQHGLTPADSSITRRRHAETAVHFDAGQKRIAFSSSNKSHEWAAGGQDRASMLMQLASIGNANAAQLATGKTITLQVAEDRDSKLYQFIVTGSETIASALGNLSAVHLRRVLPEHSPQAILEVWLAPDLHWYPIQIRSTEFNGMVTTQTVSQLTINPRTSP